MAAPQQDWILDETRNLWYRIDYVTRQYVYQDGTTLPLPTTQSPPPAQSPPGARPRTLPGSSIPAGSRGPAASSASTTPQVASPRNTRTTVVSSDSSKSPTYQAVSGKIAITQPVFVKRSEDFFQRFQVIALRPAELPHGLRSAVDTNLSDLRAGNETFSGVRRFVVITEANQGYVLALPILTYGGQGVAADGVVKHEHGIIHTHSADQKPPFPPPLKGELPVRKETGMLPTPIRVKLRDLSEKLHRCSRINYGQPTSIPITVPVHHIGDVARDSQGPLLSQAKYVRNHKRQEEQREVAASEEDPRTRQEEAQNADAAFYQAEYHKRKAKGQLEIEILQYLITVYQRTHPSLSWNEASAIVQRLLRS
ncbi:hypothetical protein CB0940_08199 [Cercospora beticola]|uniref:DUF6590 domain-containing protein n=1 Tax=Cercospora beticola TaxID=122368 RepID=A0A2G5HQG6_CERBT|nr:hypothetical protein CB0940_08199 [Cercospora beticola]PIA94791.1 hypothetical protein CB0940_08199 [Cercospora beticola]WPB04766.1 hypothetical protein RHO25_009413 [Cercospora beticola]